MAGRADVEAHMPFDQSGPFTGLRASSAAEVNQVSQRVADLSGGWLQDRWPRTRRAMPIRRLAQNTRVSFSEPSAWAGLAYISKASAARSHGNRGVTMAVRSIRPLVIMSTAVWK